MTIILPVDEQLLEEAVAATGEADREKLLKLALEEFIARRRRPTLSRYAGTFEFADGYEVLNERGARGLPD